jgi:Holliday junction resolvase
MRRAANIDANQPDIVKALRQAGASVTSLAGVGNGVPDLLVGIRKVTTVFEVKDGAKVPSKRKLTEDEQKWHDEWRGSKFIVESVEQALAILATL